MSDKTNEEIDFLANYIAEELMDVKMYDFNSIRSKISFSLKMIKEKKDLFNRTNLKYKTVKIDNTYPYEIISNQKKYKKWIEQN